ncbi:MAG: T9SS type B sorting domain-containing protein [Bacteroidia bacterium]
MQFPAGVNAGSAQTGPNYGCLGSQPNPAWFYFQIGSGGPLVITMSANNDIDFICYGPFSSLSGNCGNLTAANTVGCSYSSSATETLTIANAVPGQFYLLMITNFSNQNQQITFSQTNSNTAGAAQTNCGVLCSMTVTATNSLCAGHSATMTAVTGTQVVSVHWNGPGYSSTTGNTVVPNMQSTGVYTAIATTTGTNPATNTCAVTKTITVIQNPTLTISNNGPVCAGAQVNLTGGGATTYTWAGPNSFASNIASPSFPNAQQVNSGQYTLIGSTNGCTATANTSLTVKPNPTVTASNAGAYCAGQSFSLSTSGANTYTWAGPNNFVSNLQNPVLTNNTLAYAGTYTVLGAINGCTSTANTNVTIYALPNITASTSSANVCQNSSFTLSAAGGTAYVWSGPMGFSSFGPSIPFTNAQPIMTGTYNIVGTDANGCVNSATLAQVVNPNPVPTALGSTKCLNEDLQLSATGGLTYQWSGPAGFTSNMQNPTVPGAQFGNAGVYTVTVSINGCVATATTSCDILQNPVIGFTGNTEICQGGIFSFLGTGGINYKWLTMFGELSQANSFTVSTLSPQLQSTYTLVGVDGNGCHNQVVIYPVVLSLPHGNVAPMKEGDCVPFSTRFNMTNISPNISTIQWNFSNGTTFADSTSATYNVGTAGTHSVTIALTDDRGCKSSITGTVEGYPIPKADFTFSPETPTENDYDVDFTNTTKNAPTVQWYWDFYSNGQAISIKENPTYVFPEIGNYFVFFKVVSDHGCIDSTIKKLTVSEDVTFYLPNSFTPNGDGVNEVFMPKSVGVKRFRMDIFDRWGQLIFSTNDITVGWDGKHKKGGELLPQDVYVYKISAFFNNGSKPKQYTGHVTLLR